MKTQFLVKKITLTNHLFSVLSKVHTIATSSVPGNENVIQQICSCQVACVLVIKKGKNITSTTMPFIF